jgi:hypothetical protein
MKWMQRSTKARAVIRPAACDVEEPPAHYGGAY